MSLLSKVFLHNFSHRHFALYHIHHDVLLCLLMLIDINRIQLLGRVGSDPKKLGRMLGKEIVTFNMATYTYLLGQTEESSSEGK